MQKALIVYESMFGNTETVARAVASGLESSGSEVTLLPVAEAVGTDLGGYDVVVAGAPTHVLGLSRPSTREDAVRQGADQERAATGMREWLDGLAPTVGATPRFAVFDTRVGSGRARHFSGSAARRAAKVLRRRHRRLIDEPVSFYVSGTSGPLLPGEDIRARSWGSRLAREATAGQR